jgi:hypothetical protein
MNTAITVVQVIFRIAALIQIVLGLLFWSGNLLNLVPIHMLIGLIFVISLWVLAVLTARRGVPLGFVAVAVVWGVIVLVLGLTQTQLLPGAAHWVIEILHLLVGLAAMGLGERLVRMSKLKQETALAV